MVGWLVLLQNSLSCPEGRWARGQRSLGLQATTCRVGLSSFLPSPATSWPRGPVSLHCLSKRQARSPWPPGHPVWSLVPARTLALLALVEPVRAGSPGRPRPALLLAVPWVLPIFHQKPPTQPVPSEAPLQARPGAVCRMLGKQLLRPCRSSYTETDVHSDAETGIRIHM